MSSQSSVYSEKKIAAYESLFKESNFAKPQEVYLTITVAHVFGQAYILEQEGTKEGDPVYSRFVCPLEEITKVYVNDKIKKPWPLFIQCDTNVKGVIHRKRIVIPCLENPNAIAQQINEVKAVHMEKYEAAIERENQKKRSELENARLKEQSQHESKSNLPPLPSVEKLPDPVPVPEKAPATKKSAASLSALNSELADSFKALENFETPKKDIKPLPKKPKFDLDEFDDIPIPAPKASKPEENPASEKPKAKNILELEDIDSIISSMPVPKAPAPAPKASEPVKEEIRPIEKIETPIIPEPVISEEIPEIKPEPVPAAENIKPAAEEIAPIIEEVEPVIDEPAPVIEEVKPIEAKPEPVKETPKPAPAPIMVNPNGKAAELSDFESAVIALKAKLDSGEITAEEFSAEKKKLISTLY